MVSFRQFMEAREAPGGMDLTVNVLMLSYWPTYPIMNINLLPQVKSHNDAVNVAPITNHGIIPTSATSQFRQHWAIHCLVRR